MVALYFRSPPRPICNFFYTLPSKKDYPDYYLFIKSPISLKEIRVSDVVTVDRNEIRLIGSF